MFGAGAGVGAGDPFVCGLIRVFHCYAASIDRYLAYLSIARNLLGIVVNGS